MSVYLYFQRISHRVRHAASLFLLCCLLTLFVTDSAAQQQRPTLTEEQYRALITNFVNANLNTLVSRISSNNDVYRKYFSRCAGGNTQTVRTLFVRQLSAAINDSINDVYSIRQLSPPFGGRGRPKATTDCQAEINSSAIASRIDGFINKGCASANPPPEQVNHAPNANAGPGITITLPTNFVTLQGSGSDPDNDPLTFRWTQISGFDNERIVSPNSPTTRIENLNQGRHVYMLTVSDNRRGVDTSTVIVSVNPEQQQKPRPPTAEAGNPITITLPTNRVTLVGSGSDPNGSALTYRWTKISGGSAQIASETNSTTNVENLQAGTYQFQLTVTNRFRLSASDNVQVTVNEQQNNPPSVDAGFDQTISLPQTRVQLNGRATDPENDPLTYRWRYVSGPSSFQIQTPGNASTLVTNLTEGEYVFLLEVLDGHHKPVTDQVKISVITEAKPPPRAPTANAGSPIVITLPTNKVTLFGSGTDPNGSALTFRWTKLSGNGGLIVSERNATTAVENLQKGTYQFRLRVTNRFEQSATDDVQVTVNEQQQQPNAPPVANAGTAKVITLPLNRVQLTGSGTDPDGDPLTYHWKYGSGPREFSIQSSESASTLVDNLVEGEYYFILEVSDGHHPPVSDRVRIRVNTPRSTRTNQPPVANAGPDQKLNLSEGSAITLHGSGRDDDGTIQSYHWEKKSGPESFRFMTPNTAEGRIEDPAPGEYVFQLTVTDNQGATASAIVLLQVIKTNGGGIPPWVWILAATIGLGAATTVIRRRYLWLWQKQKVIAYYLNDHEKALVHQYMPDSDNTEGYSVGHLSRRKIMLLKKKGIAFRIINTTHLIVNTPGIEREFKFDLKRGEFTWESDISYLREGDFENIIPVAGVAKSGEADFPAFYIITLDSPLLPQFQAQLAEIGITVLQRIPYDSYIIFIPDAEKLRKLEDEQATRFSFVRVLRPYLPEDTGFLILKEHTPGRAGTTNEWIIDLVLHREESRDFALVRDFLGINGIEQIDSYRNIIRVRMRRDMNLAQKLASNKFIQAIYEHLPPVLHNDFARKLIGLDSIENNLDTRYLKETGEGEVIAVADTGIDQQHPDLAGRIKKAIAWGRKQLNDTSDPHGHGTHVTGSIVGTGAKSAGTLRGVAPGAQVVFQSLLDNNNQLIDLKLNLPPLLEEAFKEGAKIMNISWGSATASYYTFDSVAVDQFVFDNPDMLIVVSSGNANTIVKDSTGREISLFGSVGSLATTKNGITVGASRSNRNKEDAESIAPFSSRGPCKNDRRVKPDLVAPGTNILSTRSSRGAKANFDSFDANAFYAFLHGSSMAAPMVAGAAALVRQYYKEQKKYPNPSAALVKATILNGTRQLHSDSATQDGTIIPNNSQGFGMLDLLMTIPNEHTKFNLQFRDAIRDQALMLSETGKTKIFKLELKEATWLRACLVFVDSPKMGAQNDLNLIVGLEGSTTKWTGNQGINAKEQHWSHIAEDFTNNIEVARIENAQPGQYTIAVTATVAPLQDDVGYALVVTTGDLSALLTN